MSSSLLVAILCIFWGTDRTVVPGVTYQEIHRQIVAENPRDPAVPLVLYVLTLDPRQVDLRLGQAMDTVVGAETTSSISRRASALAAINGGYFRMVGVARGEPVGLLVVAGAVLSEPVRNRASLAVAQGSPLQLAIVHPSLSLTLRIGSVRIPVDGINRPREVDELVVYTPQYHRTTLTEPGGLEVLVRRGRISPQEVRGRVAGSRPIPEDGFVVSAHGKARERLEPIWQAGRRVVLETSLTMGAPIHFHPQFVLGAGPQLLRQGMITLSEQADRYAPTFFTARAPRTAIGWRADGTILLVVVDGRQPDWSVGMTLEELAQAMRELGCQEALNLDGGGSTTMVLQEKVVNRPSDAAGERPVSDALLVFPRATIGGEVVR
jgi:hypothetical protein